MAACISYPWSVVLALLYVYLLVMIYVLSDRCSFFKWLSGRTSCLISIAAAFLGSLVLGLVGGDAIPDSIWFTVIILFLTTTIGIAAIRDIHHFRSSPKGPTLAHLGIFLILMVGLFGKGDKQVAYLMAQKDVTTATAVRSDGTALNLPFMLTLKDFVMEEYEMSHTPKKYMSTVSLADGKRGMRTVEIEVNHPARVGAWRLYQYKYDLSRGEDNPVSVFECVKDPWYGLAAPAMWMILLSGLVVFYSAGSKKKKI